MKFATESVFFGSNHVKVKEIEFSGQEITFNSIIPYNRKFFKWKLPMTGFTDVELTGANQSNGVYFLAAFKPVIKEHLVKSCLFVDTGKHDVL